MKQLRGKLKYLREEIVVPEEVETESNTLMRCVEYIRQCEDIPVKDLMVLNGILHGKPVKY